MKTISIKSRIGSDGLLKIVVPTDERETDVDVIIVIQTNNTRKKSWPNNFFDTTYGCLGEDPIERLEQGKSPARNELL